MSSAIALLRSEIPLDLIESYELPRRVHERGGDQEVRFYYRDNLPVLPVWYEGGLRMIRWGNRRRAYRGLPPTGWTWQATVEGGGWHGWDPEPVEIHATFGLENGVWYRVRQGMRGILVRDDQDVPIVYMICEPATRYYEVMTRSKRMPVLINERI